jgi:hypothetical protein
MTRIRITASGFAFGRTGTAQPAFSRGRYHVHLDGDRTTYAFDDDEFEVLQ